VLKHDINNHANRGARGQGALIDGRMRLFGTASKSLPLRWGRCAPWQNVLKHDILFINRGRDKHWSDDIWMTFFVGTIDVSPTPSTLDFAASLGALRAVVKRAEAQHFIVW